MAAPPRRRATATAGSGHAPLAQTQQSRLAALARRHRGFTVLFAGGMLLRLAAMLAYRPALWFNDAFEYVAVALRPYPYPLRPDGYSFLLLALKPAHSFLLVVALQHLVGLASAGLVYILCRRLGAPGWAACLAAAPVMLDAHQVQLEHLVLSDTVFTGLVLGAVALVLQRGRLSSRRCATAGAMLAASMITRPAAVPVIVLVLAYLTWRRVGWRAVTALVVALAMPLAAYGLWYRTAYGALALDSSTGIQLYGRVAGFADCRRMHPDPQLAVLCPPDPGNGQAAPLWIWHPVSPLNHIAGPGFTPAKEQLARAFAVQAILTQPLDYLHLVHRDVVHLFSWSRGPYPNDYTEPGWQFSIHPWPISNQSLPSGGTQASATRAYQGGDARTRVYQPYADLLVGYQRLVIVRGPLLAALLLLGLLGLATSPSRGTPQSRAELIVVEAAALGLLFVPIFAVQLDYRYTMPCYPFAGLAAVLGAARVHGWAAGYRSTTPKQGISEAERRARTLARTRLATRPASDAPSPGRRERLQ